MGMGSLGIGRVLFGSQSSNVVRTTSYTKKTTKKSSSKKLKRLQYNFKEISTQLMRAKTSGNAKQVATKARGKIALLRQKLRIGEYDDKEVEDAIKHAMRMERVAKKRMKHLKEEERVEKGKKAQETNPEEELMDDEETYEEFADQNGLSFDDAYMSEEQRIEMQENLQELLRSMQELMQRTMDQWTDETENPMEEELLELETEDMSAEDFEKWKKKHRSEELRDIMEADLKYLKAVFDRLAKEKQELMSGSVSLELGGMDIPVEEPPMPVPAEGGAVDVQA